MGILASDPDAMLSILPKEGVERSHRPDVVSKGVGCLGRVFSNKPNQLKKGKERANLVYRLQAQSNGWSLTPLYTRLGAESAN